MKTFLDTGVLITAWRATRKESAAALAVITDESRKLLTCDIVKLELLPKPVFFRQKDEIEFYTEIFQRSESLAVTEKLYQSAWELATAHGLAAGDALNLAAAIELGADEFVTTETTGNALFRVKQIRVISLHAAGSK